MHPSPRADGRVARVGGEGARRPRAVGAHVPFSPVFVVSVFFGFFFVCFFCFFSGFLYIYVYKLYICMYIVYTNFKYVMSLFFIF